MDRDVTVFMPLAIVQIARLTASLANLRLTWQISITTAQAKVSAPSGGMASIGFFAAHVA